jgi:nucleotide-binding universal stress UspA family protein
VRRAFHVLVAADGSPSALAAVQTALALPWPEPSRARGVVALGERSAMELGFGAEGRRRLYAETGPVQRRLARRWSDAAVFALHERPVDAIFSEARRFGAHAIVLGWRGHGALRRWLAGSVSREVVARARIPVVVARTPLEKLRRLVLAFDASPGAWAAVRFAAKLERQRGMRILLTTVVEPLRVPPAVRRLPADIRNDLHAEMTRLNRAQIAAARREARAAAAELRRAGWPVKIQLRAGIPLDEVLGAAQAGGGTLLVVGEREKSGVARLVLGSVTDGALDQARVPVLVVR